MRAADPTKLAPIPVDPVTASASALDLIDPLMVSASPHRDHPMQHDPESPRDECTPDGLGPSHTPRSRGSQRPRRRGCSRRPRRADCQPRRARPRAQHERARRATEACPCSSVPQRARRARASSTIAASACPQVNDTVPLSSVLAAIRATLWKLFIALVTRRFAFLSWVVSAARQAESAPSRGAGSTRGARCRRYRPSSRPTRRRRALGDQAIGDVIALDCFGRAGLCGGLRAVMGDPLATASRGSRHHPALPPRSARMGTISLPSSLPSPPGRWPLRQASLL